MSSPVRSPMRWKVPADPVTSVASRPWWPSCSARCSPTSPCSAGRTSNSWPSSPGWSADLDMDIEIVGVPTVREPDGLAVSSRNQRLSAEDRAAAVCIVQALRLAAQAYQRGDHDPEHLVAVASTRLEAEPRATPEYIRVVDPVTLDPVVTTDQPAVMVAAVWFGDVRLIDNIQLSP